MLPNVYLEMVESKKILDKYKDKNIIPNSSELAIVSRSNRAAKDFLKQLNLPFNLEPSDAITFALYIEESLY